MTGENYAAQRVNTDPELEEEETDEKSVHLLAKAKKGQYHPIWYDPEDLMSDPPKSKAVKYCPKGWKPWVVPVGQGWELIQGPTSTLKELSLQLIPKMPRSEPEES